MKRWIVTVLCAATCLCMAGCGGSPETFIKKTESPDAGLRTELKTGAYTYTLQYCPYDYLYIKEQKGQNLSRQGYETRKKELDGLLYFTLTVEDVSGKQVFDRSSPDFDRVYNYYASYMEYSVAFTCDGNEQPCALYHVEGLYGLKSAITVHMAFENVCNGNGNWNLDFVNELEGSRPVRLSLLKTDIDNRPQFKF